MRHVTKVGLSLALTAAVLSTGGCLEDTSFDENNPMDVLMLVLGSAVPKKAKATRIEVQKDVQFSGSIGGLSGTFDVTVGSYGALSGTAQIKGQKKAKMKLVDDPDVEAVVEAALLDTTGVEVDVTSTKLTFKGSQTTGGVEKRFGVLIRFKGTVAAGVDAGKAVKGKLKSKGSYQ